MDETLILDSDLDALFQACANSELFADFTQKVTASSCRFQSEPSFTTSAQTQVAQG